MKNPKAWSIGLALTAAALLLVVIGGAAAWNLAETRREQGLRTQVEKRLEAIHASGQPVTAQDLARLFPDPPPEVDAARLLHASLSLIKDRWSFSELPLPVFGEAPWPARREPLSDEVQRAVRAFVETNQAALKALPAVWPNNVRMPNRFHLGFTNPTPVALAQVNTLNALLVLDCLHQVEKGNTGRAVDDLIMCLRISRTLSPTLLMHLVRLSGEDRSCSALERLLTRVALPPRDLAALTEVLTNAPTNGLRSVLWGHRSLDIWAFESMRSALSRNRLSRANSVLGFLRKHVERRIYSEADFLRCLDAADGYLGLLDLPAAQQVKRARQLDEAQKRMPASFLRIVGAPEWMPVFRGDAETEARLRTAQVALAIEGYRGRHEGCLPASLDVLVPEYLPTVPRDPFTHQSLLFLKRERGYVVYSVGPDNRDDAGREKPAGKTEGTRYDITFTVER